MILDSCLILRFISIHPQDQENRFKLAEEKSELTLKQIILTTGTLEYTPEEVRNLQKLGITLT